MPTNILLVGVGGQGIITASNVISEACLISGFHVKKSEVHGMSQRGGSVESHVRYSPDEPVRSPLIPGGEADVLLAFETLEALRGLPMVAADGMVLVDDHRIVPMSVTSGPFDYPADPLAMLAESGRNVRVIKSFEVAGRLGEQRAANVVMLGAASQFTDIPRQAWEDAIRATVKKSAVDLNLRAFGAGIEALIGE